MMDIEAERKMFRDWKKSPDFYEYSNNEELAFINFKAGLRYGCAALAAPQQEPIGTLILGGIESCVGGDELGEIDVELHTKIVEVLQEKIVRSTDPIFLNLYIVPPAATVLSDDTRRLDFITTFGEPWMVQWEKRGNKPIRYRMLDDGEPWGTWHATARQAIDAALLAKVTP
jgi:hypothetical protein